MRGEDRLLRIAEYLIGCAARLLPSELRDERRREWTAELPAILGDPDTWPPARRAARMLRYAAGVLWGTTRSPSSARARVLMIATVVVILFGADLLVMVPIGIWGAITAPGDWVHYYLIALSVGWLASLGGVMAWKVRRADRPMEGVRDTIVIFGTWNIFPSLLLSPRLRAAAAELKSQASPPKPPEPPKPVLPPETTVRQAVGMARVTVRRFHRARWRPGYQMAEVDAFVAQIEAMLMRGRHGGPLITAADVEAVKFGTLWNQGYDEETVDRALDYYAAALARLIPRQPAPPAEA